LNLEKRREKNVEGGWGEKKKGGVDKVQSCQLDRGGYCGPSLGLLVPQGGEISGPRCFYREGFAYERGNLCGIAVRQLPKRSGHKAEKKESEGRQIDSEDTSCFDSRGRANSRGGGDTPKKDRES